MPPISRADWLVPASLVLLVLFPIAAGAFRVGELTGGAEVTPDNVRFFANPVPVILHIISASIFTIVGAFQFSPALRQRNPEWHRFAGRILVPSGLILALSGMWMANFYVLPETDGGLLYFFRMLFGSAMFIFILLGYRAVLRRDFAIHRAWMMRAYAIAAGTGTQVFTLTIGILSFGEDDFVARASMMGAAWMINLVFVEWLLWRGQKMGQRRIN